ncbi:heavy metal translocating P-type ATPase [Ammoniphilus sp. CFH 90114]|uniref:heavy metal translocating P-type ATPase n=1 Tax=Ammoniphilus sp. CFH 90114 TaxID=2493665 RepID=UPI00100F6529|nr:heavy metal translocating P-type ATPase [Ammoniphilus sp. CFH 90114]RXT15259.1 cadmium-translocating P-type ATPase [Ammoniphilus sp. CFH 90114]
MSDLKPAVSSPRTNSRISTSFLLQHGEGLAAMVCGILTMIAWFFDHFNYSEVSPYIYLCAYIVGGFVKAKEGLYTLLKERELDVNLLMLLAAMGAAGIGYWLEGAILIFIFSLSGVLESYTMARSYKDIASLMDLKPETATMLKDGKECVVKIEQLQVGDLMVVKPGERIPSDGKIIEGRSSVNQASITGESIPVEKGLNDEVYAGTLNENGALIVEVTCRSESTLFSKIIQLVQEAQSEKPVSQTFMENFERIYAKVIIGVTLVLILVPSYFLSWSFEDSLYRAMVFLVVASPCALVASIMPVVLSSISNAARHGILFKGGAHLENLSEVKVVAVDKTGTLTYGRPKVTDVFTFQQMSQEDLFYAVGSIESLSEHPLSKAVVEKAKELQLSLDRPKEIEAVTGFGIQALFSGEYWKIGKSGFMEPSVVTAEGKELASRLESEGKTVVFIQNTKGLAGIMGIQDIIRPDALAAVKQLQKQGIKVIMLTGDREGTAQVIAEQSGVDDFYAELLPEQKVEMVRKLKEKYGKVAMLGDGVNDAPALATATVGIAMGTTGSDVALETADLVLMNDDLEKIPSAIRLGKRAKSVIKQNIVFSLSVILLLIISNFAYELALPLGVIGHEGSTILVILNGLRLLKM